MARTAQGSEGSPQVRQLLEFDFAAALAVGAVLGEVPRTRLGPKRFDARPLGLEFAPCRMRVRHRPLRKLDGCPRGGCDALAANDREHRRQNSDKADAVRCAQGPGGVFAQIAHCSRGARRKF